MLQHTSEFIFSLATKYGILLENLNPSEFSDDCYLNFCREYFELSKNRDAHLKKHLIKKSTLFRTFLPWREHIFNSVFQLQWYYDEMVIYDPIIFEITHFKSGNIEEDKRRLRQILVFLNSLKENIDNGFLLFGSYDTFASNIKSVAENKFEELISRPEIREECDKLVHVYKMESPEGIEKSYFNVRSYYRNKQVMFTVIGDIEKVKTEEGYSVWFDLVDSEYKLLTIDETKVEGFYDRAYDGFKYEYNAEIKEIVGYIDISSNIQTPVLFNRKLDELVLSEISPASNAMKNKTNEYHKLLLPFVNGIPPERLFEVRTKMPTAFTDFRNLMFEIIYDFEKAGIEPNVLELKIQQKINPLLKKLNVEMKNSLTKAKIMGAGLPITSGLGALALSYFNIDISTLSSFLLGGVGVAAEFNVLTNYFTEQRAGKSNSLYYLWKVQQ